MLFISVLSPNVFNFLEATLFCKNKLWVFQRASLSHSAALRQPVHTTYFHFPHPKNDQIRAVSSPTFLGQEALTSAIFYHHKHLFSFYHHKHLFTNISALAHPEEKDFWHTPTVLESGLWQLQRHTRWIYGLSRWKVDPLSILGIWPLQAGKAPAMQENQCSVFRICPCLPPK